MKMTGIVTANAVAIDAKVHARIARGIFECLKSLLHLIAYQGAHPRAVKPTCLIDTTTIPIQAALQEKVSTIFDGEWFVSEK
mmetsp:Transcript_44210/g.95213  ORF Transcript_44210/g.95213 Transcript_44210/m.95213 type:complete len:82 (-) Transcript_44210:371-616(-)